MDAKEEMREHINKAMMEKFKQGYNEALKDVLEVIIQYGLPERDFEAVVDKIQTLEAV